MTSLKQRTSIGSKFSLISPKPQRIFSGQGICTLRYHTQQQQITERSQKKQTQEFQSLRIVFPKQSALAMAKYIGSTSLFSARVEFCCVSGLRLFLCFIWGGSFLYKIFLPVTEKLYEKLFRKKYHIQSKQDFWAFGSTLHAGTTMEKNLLSTKEHRAAVSSCHSSRVQASLDYSSCAEGKKSR